MRLVKLALIRSSTWASEKDKSAPVCNHSGKKPYAIRAWAIRDMVIAILVAFANQQIIKTLLIGCVAIDFTDIISAYLSGVEGLFGGVDGWLLKLTSTAIAALFFEMGALALILSDRHRPTK